MIELQPKAVQRFREDIETLSQIVRENGGEISPELALPFRQMVAAVVIEPRQPGEPYALNIKGYLSKLIGDEHSVIRLVAGARIHAQQRLLLERFIALISAKTARHVCSKK
ncbi:MULTISPECIES: hypothetical protein [unclassified Neorhizobium]|uniref:hypothetical protein n=1 Tax=unclassified Neorhizobium TaxID=2629175 RepID=UPI001FF60FFA|nr:MULTISPECIES: hypothetical protein [unclassified Neorhizobium]MCJ9668507.1 hypothetical protein [Neorhizobium sp. SHOUNA12B]MCJ9743962.1 hypothetical protein [Neorhizobium sp. SHOUNA12A]